MSTRKTHYRSCLEAVLAVLLLASLAGCSTVYVDTPEPPVAPARKAPARVVSAAELRQAAAGLKETSVTDLERSPRVASAPYPESLGSTGEAGWAVVLALVGEDGHPELVAVEQATRPEFGEAALRSVSQWWFPVGDKPERLLVSAQVSFSRPRTVDAVR